MSMPPIEPPPVSEPAREPELEAALAAVDHHLAMLGRALHDRLSADIEREAAALHRALAAAVQRFAQAARAGGVPAELRRRLALASGEVAAQRESLARATAALDRAIDVLLPGAAASNARLYSAGSAERTSLGGSAQA